MAQLTEDLSRLPGTGVTTVQTIVIRDREGRERARIPPGTEGVILGRGEKRFELVINFGDHGIHVLEHNPDQPALRMEFPDRLVEQVGACGLPR